MLLLLPITEEVREPGEFSAAKARFGDACQEASRGWGCLSGGKQCFPWRCKRALAASKFLREAKPKSKGKKAKRVCATIRRCWMRLIKKAGWDGGRRATEGPRLSRRTDPGTVTAEQEEVGASTLFPVPCVSKGKRQSD